MKLTIEIKCDNAAFSDDDGECRAVGPECARILRKFCETLDADHKPIDDERYKLFDVNGNAVGLARFSR